MTGNVGVYLRDDKVYLVPQGGGGGLYYDIEPIQVVPPSGDEVTQAIRAALDTSARTAGQPVPDLKKRRSPLLTKASVGSLRDFYSNAAYAFLYTDGAGLMLLPFRPADDGRGFQPSGDPIQLVNDQTMGAQVLSVLQSLPRATAKSAR